MITIYQSPTQPDQVSFAIRDLISGDLTGIRIAVAYATLAGCESLVGAIEEKLGVGASRGVSKLLVTSFDYGHTEPQAVSYWRDLLNGEVRIANVRRVQGNLSLTAGNTNFHPKVYLFDHPDRVAALIGSANLTRRTLSANTEAAFAERTADRPAVDGLWLSEWNSGAILTDLLLDEYQTNRNANPLPSVDSTIETPPAVAGALGIRLIDAINQGLDPSRYQCFWIQAGSMSSGGSRNQLELPRGGNRFFGFNYDTYADEHVDIGHPVLISHNLPWTDRSLTWHSGGGQNAMERLNLPTATQGGFEYGNMAILFRRIPGGFEFTAARWGTDRANAWMNASTAIGAAFHLGRTANTRMCGLF